MYKPYLTKCLLASLLLFLLFGCSTKDQSLVSDDALVTVGYIGDPNFAQDPNRKDWLRGYYANALGQFIPLNGQNPTFLGDGGGTPAVWYKIDDRAQGN